MLVTELVILMTRFDGDLFDSSGAGNSLGASTGNVVTFADGSPSVWGLSTRSATRWRLLVVSDVGSGPFGVAELSWFSERKKLDLTTALTSFTASDGSDLTLAIDSDKNSVALSKPSSSGDAGKWIELQFKTNVDASRVTIQTPLSADNCVSAIAIQRFDTASQTWYNVSQLLGLQYPRTSVSAYGRSPLLPF